MASKVAVNIISGQLGSGKTTLLQSLTHQKPKHEKWTILVNEFGAIGIDDALLKNNANLTVKAIPGGCICCSAQNELKAILIEIIESTQPDRLLIEPTGLSEPESLVDLLTLPSLQNRLELQSLISVFDCAHISADELKNMSILQSLLNMADVLILNKTDLASPSQVESLQHYCETLYPPKQHILLAKHGNIALNSLYYSHFHQPKFKPSQAISNHVLSATHQLQQHEKAITKLPYTPQVIPFLIERAYQKQLGTQALGWVFDSDQTFSWQAIMVLLENLHLGHFTLSNHQASKVQRAKGIFRVGSTARMVFQMVHGDITRDFIAHRKDSRFEILLSDSLEFDFTGFENALLNCLQKE